MAAPAAAVIGNGSAMNREFEDLAEPLPADWDLEKLRTLKITLYEMRISPPCCKLRFLLEYYKIPFTKHDGKKPGSEYKKVPVLDVEDRQINDSFVMVKSLALVLQGRPLTAEEEGIEKEMTAGFMIAAEKHTASSCGELCACAPVAGGSTGVLMRLFSCCICCCIAKKIGKGKELKPIEDYGDLLRGHLGSNQFLSGGSEPGVLDVSVFGVTQPWAKAKSPVLQELLGPSSDPLSAWHERMKALSTHVDIFRK